jgi:hypothetical protein
MSKNDYFSADLPYIPLPKIHETMFPKVELPQFEFLKFEEFDFTDELIHVSLDDFVS